MLDRPDMPGGRHWRITFYNEDRKYVSADILEVNKDNSLVFKRMTVYDVALKKAAEYIVSHSEARGEWSAVTECNEKGVPMWLFDYAGPVYGEDPEDGETDLELEALRLLVEATNKKITTYNKRTTRKTEG